MRPFLHFSLSLVLLIQLAASPARSAENKCRALFTPATPQQRGWGTRVPSFELEYFQREKNRILAQPETALKPGDRPETILAWIEARSERYGFSFDISKDPALLEKRAASWKNALVKEKWFSGETKSSGERLRMALMMIHGQLHAYGWRDLPRSFLPNTKTAVAERVQSEILAGELVNAFAKSGMIIDSLHAERLSHRFYASGGWNWALQLSLSLFSPLWTRALLPPGLGGGAFLPPVISGARFEYLRKLPPELEMKIKIQGYEAARADLMKHFAVPAHASWMINTATRIFGIACLLIFLEQTYEYYPWIKGFVKSVFESGESFHQERVEMGADAIREQLVASWQEWYESTYQRAPSAEELDKARARMRAIPDDKLLGRSPSQQQDDKTSGGNERS